MKFLKEINEKKEKKMMDEKEGKFVFISRRKIQNVKTIKKNHIGNYAGYEIKRKSGKVMKNTLVQ